MRIRSIKPEFWRSVDIATLEIADRFLFIGLWSYVDDNGVGVDDTANIIGDLFARDMFLDPRETVARVSRGLSNLSDQGLIVRYTVAKRPYLFVTNWEKHQRIDKPARARYPRWDDENAVLATPSRDRRDTLAPGTGEQGNRGTGEQGGGRGETPPPTPTCKRHPEGTDNPCAACKKARLEWDKANQPEAPKTPVVGKPPECELHPDWPLPCDKCRQIAAEQAA